jgi:putative membrane protein
MNFIIKVLISGVITFVLSKILSGIKIDNIGIAILFALVLALLNAFVKPILVFLSLPITVITLGFFLLIINAGIILLAAKIVDGIKVDGIWWAMLFSIILSIFNSAAQSAIEKK